MNRLQSHHKNYPQLDDLYLGVFCDVFGFQYFEAVETCFNSDIISLKKYPVPNTGNQ